MNKIGCEEQDNIFYNWDKYGAEQYQLISHQYNHAIQDILDSLGGFPDVRLSNLPTYRTSKNHILKQVPKTSELQMVPKLPPNLIVEMTGDEFDKTKISAKFLDKKKTEKVNQLIN